ncbi:T9SS type A sorting domain-containing protein [Emticicia fluvialis]|uniref:T9SS type A sorting domain-containing protein n=1 Tax=Emticicia fluvialis TaxID=2974474 RepID=UPI002166A4B3|nr:T9SS type A sorting domain-containing protein [Emticicia fluvialis]
MKATFRNSIKASFLAALAIASFASYAQDKKEKKSTVRVRIEQDINGKTKVHEKNFDATGLTDKQKEELIQNYQDSVMAKNKENVRGTKVEVESFSDNERERISNNDDHFERRLDIDSEKPRVRAYSRGRNGNDNHFEFGDDDDAIIREKPRTRVYRNDRDKDFETHFDLDMKGLNENLNQLGKDLKFEFKTFPDVFDFDGSASSKTVRGLSVYPNNPKTEILNLRFNSQQKGDVSIKVMDLKGNVIAKDEVRDFSGEYVGQINIGKHKGVVFVMVTQGEDGTVKRVNLSADKE